MHYFLLAAVHFVFGVLFDAQGDTLVAALQLSAGAFVSILGVVSIAARH